ncbi:MAG: hypothetical protein KBC22_00655 [Candidatus Pacebacteria bacterium]|nr:hypothetical protein [Candidatus Paceibacterota bacterium]
MIVSVCATETAFGQRKKVKRIETQIELYPLDNSITLKAGTGGVEQKLYLFLSKETNKRRGRFGELLMTTDESLLKKVQSFRGGSYYFESFPVSRKDVDDYLDNAKADGPTQELLIKAARKAKRKLWIGNVTRPQ